eukprot:TRINITY_DN71159_c0_g1_i1.p2 TRINITY_DN71159_c0_g1~~TRINITY_DN71159_c0_g1_i1.p2  ORF type:complete len:423 (+),score=34.69 TRINITY_DN71159_c0_g1_i1:4925-6193(+)
MGKVKDIRWLSPSLKVPSYICSDVILLQIKEISMYQPVRLYSAQRPRSHAIPCFLCCIALVALVTLTVTFVHMFSAPEGISLSATFPALEEVEASLAFRKFVDEYGKTYASADETEKRKAIFASNYKRINEFNRKNSQVTLGVNQFADLTDEEFEQLYLQHPPTNEQCTVAHELIKKNPPKQKAKSDPIDINWVREGKVLPVKDQGNCGSCWTFAATSVIESIYAIRENPQNLVRFAEQQLVDCCRSGLAEECSESNGCRGGMVGQAFQYAANKGVTKSVDYPYHATDETCKYDSSKVVFKLDGYVNITAGDVDEMEKALTTRTFAVGVSAGYFAFRFYKKGVLNTGCPEGPINHGVVVVGAGTEDNLDYWLVRNSWGGNWGLEGYIKIARRGPQPLGYCGISACPQYVLYKENQQQLGQRL